MSNKKHGINKFNLNPEINLKDNFYEYACGGWKKSHPLKEEYSSFGTFDVLNETAREQLQDLILELDKDEKSKIKGTVHQKISDIYKMGMDKERINREGAAPLKPFLEKLETFDMNKFPEIIGWFHNGIGNPFFSSGVGPDPNDSNMNILHLGETGLGLGDRDYYLVDSEVNKKIIEAYKKYIFTILKLAGYSDEEAQRIRENVLEMEHEIAEHKMTREDRRNPLLRVNKTTLEKLMTDYPVFDWKVFFDYLNLKNINDINISSSKYFSFLNEFLSRRDLRKFKDYLIFSFITNSTGLLSDDFVEADFELYGKVISGQKEQKPRWKRIMGLTNSVFGEAIGQIYVERYFSKEKKDYVLKLVENLRSSLSQRFNKLEWMTEATKKKAQEKLNKITLKIGYPDKWKDYEEIQIDLKDSFLINVQNASRWFARDNYSKLGKPMDKSEWFMYPQTVNAYYSPVNNEICFPAAILQPPFFDISADDALNYGAIGVVIGHEMTHAFDDQGRHYDADGNLNNWWTEKDATNFKKLADQLVNQFNSVSVFDDLHANGTFTLGENIADQGGLNIALDAYLATKPEDTEIEGFSPLQRFFLSYAGIWAINITDEAMRSRTMTDPHSLGVNRVNVTLKNIEPFYTSFDIKKDDKMYRKSIERVTIW